MCSKCDIDPTQSTTPNKQKNNEGKLIRKPLSNKHVNKSSPNGRERQLKMARQRRQSGRLHQQLKNHGTSLHLASLWHLAPGSCSRGCLQSINRSSAAFAMPIVFRMANGFISSAPTCTLYKQKVFDLLILCQW